MGEELVPIFHVEDGKEAAKWYLRLGFEVVDEHRFAPDFPAYLFLRRGNIHLHLSEHKGDARTGSVVYFYANDMDSIASEFDVKIEKQPWGREMLLADPDDNHIYVGETKE